MSSSNVHKVAVSGFGEGTNDLYDRARPSYPAEALSHIYNTIASSPSDTGNKQGWTILEPGSGTGIFSRLLIAPPQASPTVDGTESAYPSFPIQKLVGIEPSEGMRNVWKRGIDKLDPRITKGAGKVLEAIDGSFDDFSGVEKLGIIKYSGKGKGQAEGESGSGVDAVIIAQAWHWCPDHEAALTEIASYLRPGSPLILIWNLEAFEPQWQADVRTAYQPYDLGSPQYYKGWWRKMFDTQAYKDLFEEKEEVGFKWDTGVSEDQLIDRLFSKSYLTSAHLPADQRTELEAEIRRIIRQGEGGHEWVNREAATSTRLVKGPIV
ncbi:hypothetical protein I317_03989 [Kwoniella heveanensis CBS 569]|nr:hypothetical protein I317_03989 [Kwoniella heveanensis CBS 569]